MKTMKNLKNVVLLTVVLLTAIITSCSKEENAPQPVIGSINNSVDTNSVDTNSVDTITTKVVRFDLDGGNNNNIVYNSNGILSFVNLGQESYEYILAEGESLSIQAYFYQLYDQSGTGFYPSLTLTVYVDSVNYYYIAEGSSSLIYTFVNNQN